MDTIMNVLSAISLAFLIAVVLALLIGGPLWLLWNWLMPLIFGLPQITFWQAVGLNMLSSILFKTNINTNKNK
jgi:membrane protein required for beta-lactamase induction